MTRMIASAAVALALATISPLAHADEFSCARMVSSLEDQSLGGFVMPLDLHNDTAQGPNILASDIPGLIATLKVNANVAKPLAYAYFKRTPHVVNEVSVGKLDKVTRGFTVQAAWRDTRGECHLAQPNTLDYTQLNRTQLVPIAVALYNADFIGGKMGNGLPSPKEEARIKGYNDTELKAYIQSYLVPFAKPNTQ